MRGIEELIKGVESEESSMGKSEVTLDSIMVKIGDIMNMLTDLSINASDNEHKEVEAEVIEPSVSEPDIEVEVEE